MTDAMDLKQAVSSCSWIRLPSLVPCADLSVASAVCHSLVGSMRMLAAVAAFHVLTFVLLVAVAWLCCRWIPSLFLPQKRNWRSLVQRRVALPTWHAA